jgi:hypothetical protein
MRISTQNNEEPFFVIIKLDEPGTDISSKLSGGGLEPDMIIQLAGNEYTSIPFHL